MVLISEARCISADLQLSSCGCYLYIISLEFLLEEERSGLVSNRHDQSPIHICYASYQIDEQRAFTIKLLLTSVIRFEMAGVKGYGELNPYSVTWTSSEAYVTYFDTTHKLRVYKLELFSEATKAIRDESVLPGCYIEQAAHYSSHISLLQADLYLPPTVSTIRYFPSTLKYEKECLIISGYPGNTENLPVMTYLEDLLSTKWTDIGEFLCPSKVLTTPPTIQPKLVTGKLEQDGSLQMSKDSLSDRDDPVIPFPNVLCDHCLRVCHHSRLLNDPTLWVEPSRNEKAGLGNKRSGIVIENWLHHSSIFDVKVSSSRGCHLCTLLLSILLKEKPRKQEIAILSEASMASLKKKAAETVVGPYTSTGTTTNPPGSFCTEDNLRLIRNTFPNSMEDGIGGPTNQPWFYSPSVSPLIIRISLTDPPVKRGQVTIYEPTGYQSPFVLSELILQSHRCSYPPTRSESYWDPYGDPARLTKSTESEPTFNLARHWINTCLVEHRVCSIDSDLPFDPLTRVIDVDPPDGSHDPRLYATSKQDRNIRYMTLSHCWGGADILTLTDDFHEYLACGVPMTVLPQTFQDAVEICRRLNTRYLWIDSLCINQEDPRDWDWEAPRMRSIYQNSYCTIAALAGENSFRGCFAQRLHPCELPGRIGFTAYEPEGMSRQHAAPLHNRAWVLQERLLSPRTLLFGRSGISWECQTCKANEQYPDSVPMNKFAADQFKLTEVFSQLRRPYGISAVGEKAKNLFSRAWHEIVKTYCPLGLTFSADKLVAFSGIADEVQRYTGLAYYYGLWANPSQPALFLSELLWSAPIPLNHHRPLGYGGTMRAPSFSWAALDGPIDYRLTFHDRIFNISSGCHNLSRYKEADNTEVYDEKGQFLLKISSFRTLPDETVPTNISMKRSEPMIARFNKHDSTTFQILSSFENEGITYRATVIAMYAPTSSESGILFPFIWLKGPLLKLDTTKIRNGKNDLFWSHPFLADPLVHNQSISMPEDAQSQFESPSMKEDWFHADMYQFEAMAEGTTLELYCLRIARWQRKVDGRWYVAGLVLVKDESVGYWLSSTNGKADGLTRAGYFEYSWGYKDKHWEDEEDIETVTIF